MDRNLLTHMGDFTPPAAPRHTYEIVLEDAGPMGAELCTLLLKDEQRLVCDIVSIVEGSLLESAGVQAYVCATYLPRPLCCSH